MATTTTANYVNFCKHASAQQILAGTVNNTAHTLTVGDKTYPAGTLFICTAGSGIGSVILFADDTLYRIAECKVTKVNGKTGAVTLTKADVGLSSVENLTKAQIISGLATEAYVNQKVSGVYRFKGSVATYDDLPALDDGEAHAVLQGDVYNVEDTGMNYAAEISDTNNKHWDSLGATVDLSAYYTKTEVNALPAVASGITATKVAKYEGYERGKQDVLTPAQSAAVASGITSAKVTKYDGYATGKQDVLTSAQLAAVGSGITSAKVTKYDGYESAIQGKQQQLSVETINNIGTAGKIYVSSLYLDLADNKLKGTADEATAVHNLCTAAGQEKMIFIRMQKGTDYTGVLIPAALHPEQGSSRELTYHYKNTCYTSTLNASGTITTSTNTLVSNSQFNALAARVTALEARLDLNR